MEVHKIAGNHPFILEGLPPESIASAKALGEEETSEHEKRLTVKTLGLKWHAEDDTLAVCFRALHQGPKLTLRNVVSDGGRLYDPLGLTLPIAMSGRIIQQLCWAHGAGWDAPLPPKLQQRWERVDKKHGSSLHLANSKGNKTA